MDFTSKTALTDLMKLFEQKCIAGAAAITPEALAMLGLLACIELAILFLYNTMDGGEDPIYLLIKKIIKYSFFVWLIQNWATGLKLARQIFDWFSLIGVKAASDNLPINDPASIGEKGIVIVVSIIKSILFLGAGSLGVVLLKILLLATIFFTYGIVAIYVFMTTLQFYILGTLTTVLLPFGACKFTSFLSEKAIGSMCSISIKMMFLQFALCIAVPFMQSVQPFAETDTDFGNGLRVVMACIGMAIFCVGAPRLASDYLSGSPSFGDGAAGSAGGAAKSAAAKAAGVPGAAMQAAGAVQAAANAPGGRATNGRIDMAGTAKNLGRMARQRMPDRQGQQHAKSLFNVSKQLEKDRNAAKQQKDQTTLF